jgi:hypothetical protein
MSAYTLHTFGLDLKVYDKIELWKAAKRHAIEVDGCPEDQLDDLIGTEAEPDVVGCLVMLLDPGTLPGCSLYSSSAEQL